ncbi:MAG TPA: lamin tail domain-containing protein, partial [bacterium]|nr:lamin tail domain-containing protein [bacterium]
LALSGTIAPNGVFVVVNDNATQTTIRNAADLLTTSNVMGFSGDDDLVLLDPAGDTIDVMGDSSAGAWGTDITLVRKSWVVTGDRDVNNAFAEDIASQWTQYAQNDSTYIGYHTWTATSGTATGTDAITILAAPVPQVILRDTPAVYLYPDSTNATVLAGRIYCQAGDETLLGLTVHNYGTADNGDTAYVSGKGGLNLWQDVNGDSRWDSGDSWVSTLNVRGTNLWGFSSSTVLMPGGTFNFVVTVNLGANPTDGHTFRLGVDTNGMTGSASGSGPSADTANTFAQTIYNPVVVYHAGDVIITEVSWAGDGGGAGTEWFELYNATGTAISLNGWTIGDRDAAGCTHTFGAVTISAHGYFLCEASEAATGVAADDIYGDDAGNLGLTTGGDDLLLFAANGTEIDSVVFTSSWPAGASTGGLGGGYVSMERRNLDTGVPGSTASNWLAGPYTVACGALGGVSGTPKAVNSMAAYNNLKINEVQIDDMASPDENEWVELYNAGDTPINIYNWVVTDHSGHSKALPQVAIPGKAFLVMHYASGTDQAAFSGTNSVLHVYANVSDVLAHTATTRDAVGVYTGGTPDRYNVIDFVAWAATVGTALAEAQAAVDAGQWPSLETQVDIVASVPGRSVFRATDGADSNATDTGDWTQLSSTMVNYHSCGGTNKSNLAATLSGVSAFTVVSTTSDATGYRGAVGDTALIRLTATDNDATCTDVTNCTVSSSVTDLSRKVVLKLTETGLNTGIFEGTLNLRSLSSDGQWWIGCANGEYVTISSVESPAYFDTIVIGISTNPGVSALMINEFLADPSGTEPDSEYIEIYNPTDTPLTIAGCYLDDAAGGGSAVYQIPVTGTAADSIAAHGFKVYYGVTTGLELGNSSDDVRLLGPDSALIDVRSYSSASSDVSAGRCHDGGGIWWLFDGVNDPGLTPGTSNNPAPVITQVSVGSSAVTRFYWNGMQDTSAPGGKNAATAFFSSSGVAQTITITVHGKYTYDSATCTGSASAAFGDGVQTAAQATPAYTLSYTIEAGCGSDSILITLTDTCGAGDSLTISLVQDNVAPAAPVGLTAVADTAVPDTGVRLAWSSVTGETVGYYVYVDTDANGQAQRLTATALTDTTGYRAANVTLGETYVFYVVTVDSVGNESVHSDTACAPILLPFKYRAAVTLGGNPSPAFPGASPS